MSTEHTDRVMKDAAFAEAALEADIRALADTLAGIYSMHAPATAGDIKYLKGYFYRRLHDYTAGLLQAEVE